MSNTTTNNITRNLGVHIQEKEITRNSITQNYNRISLVIGSSKTGVPNLPTIVYSPENFETIFGKHDYSLEKKGSFFHRTVKDVLVEGPVLCLNLRGSDDTKDFYNYYEVSTNSTLNNSAMMKSSVRSFYDTAQGFWKRSGSVVNSLNSSDNLLLFTNQKERDISLLIIKSSALGFDIYADDYYNGINNVPSYIHPKSFISDYLVDVICIEGNWNNRYDDIKYGKYFDNYGIKSNMLQSFLNLPEIKIVKQWTGSLIPYFKDKLNNDFFIESIINDDVNETGILCAFNTEKYETDEINYQVDLLGENLYTSKNPNIDFLSYKRFLTDFIESQDQTLDIPGNCFGDLYLNNHGRTTTNTECYIYGISSKKIVLSTTSNYIIKPFNYYDNDNAYYILNGKKIDIPADISDAIVLPQILDKETKIVYAIVATLSGIETRLGIKTNIYSATHYPTIDYTKEFVITNYIFSCDKYNNYNTVLENIAIDENGCYDYIKNNIPFIKNVNVNNTYSYNFIYTSSIYKNAYIKHLELIFKSYLNINSLFLNDLGEKIYPRYINDNHITFDSNDYTVISNLQMYRKDTEFLDGNNTKPVYNYSKYPITFKTNKGILGYQSFITENYMNGNINSGDPFFYMINEYVVDIIYDAGLNKNLIVFDYMTPILEHTKIVLNHTNLNNNGLFNTLSFFNYNNRYALEVVESVNTEYKSKISIYDGANPYIINIISDINDSTHAVVEDWTGDPTIMYSHLNKKDNAALWNKTVEIVASLNENSIIINKDRYNDIRLGDMFISNDISGKIFTRVIDIYRYDKDNIAVTTDLPLSTYFNNSEAKRVAPLHKWITSYNFIHIPGYTCRPELLPNGSDTRLQEILNVLSDLTPFMTNIDKFEYRYIVDSYGAGLYPESKKELSILAEKHKYALALINIPSKKDFKSDGTKYLNSKNMFDISMLVSGGDKINNYGQSFSPYRSSYSVYLTPYVTVFENNRHIKVPPASHIAQLFMKKHNEKNRYINDAVTGLDYTIPTISGLDDVYSVDELNMLEMYGVTAITKYLNTYYCFNNRTALNNNSVLRYTHSREVMIELELSMYKTLTRHQWKNDFVLLQKDVDEVCKYYLENDMIGNFKNSVDISYIDSQIVIVNTSVEINGKLQTIILQMSILPTGYLK